MLDTDSTLNRTPNKDISGVRQMIVYILNNPFGNTCLHQYSNFNVFTLGTEKEHSCLMILVG